MTTAPETRARDEARADFRRTSSLGYQVNHLARLLAQQLRAAIASYGVVPGQFAQLLALYEEDGLTQAELTERVRIDQSTMAHTLKRMERDGLVRREPDETDRRRVRLYLTPHARELRPKLEAAASELNALTLKTLSNDEATTLLTSIERVIAGLEANMELETDKL